MFSKINDRLQKHSRSILYHFSVLNRYILIQNIRPTNYYVSIIGSNISYFYDCKIIYFQNKNEKREEIE